MTKKVFIFCMAGLGSRFFKAGYTKPKFLLNLKSHETILDLILKNVYSEDIDFYGICNNLNKICIETDLESEKSALNRMKLIFINETSGQAESLYLGLSYLLENKIVQNKTSFLTHNIDTVLLERNIDNLYKMLKKVDGVIDTFCSNSENFSYVKLNKDRQVSALIEKKVISNRASSGLYGFSSIGNYINFYNKIDRAKKEELYISQVINLMIDSGLIFLDSINENPHQTIVLGTPEEYETFISS